MTANELYLGQTFLIGLGAFFLFSRSGYIIRWQIVLWTFLTAAIYLRYGATDQLIFYSSDQTYHAELIEQIVSGMRNFDIRWWILESRAPYTLPSTVLYLSGVDIALAMKSISLLYLVGSTQLVGRWLLEKGFRHHYLAIFLCAMGPTGLLFSSLGLRETSMMFFALKAARGTTFGQRVIAVFFLALLRPHLAVAIVIGSALIALLGNVFPRVGIRPTTRLALVFVSSIIGSIAFALGSSLRDETRFATGSIVNIRDITRIASNFIGLQFLTAPDYTVALSISELFLSRLLFSETILIPLLFVITALTAQNLDKPSQLVLYVFSIYVGIATRTDNNSFRQNLPLMPLMGMSLVAVLQGYEPNRKLRFRSTKLVGT